MKRKHALALFVLFLAIHTQAAAQTGSQQTVGTRQYYLMDGRWNYYDPHDGRFHKTDSTLTVRYSGAASAATIIALEEAYSLRAMARYDAKHIRYIIPASASPLATAAALLTEAGVADAEVNVPGTPLFVPTDAYGASSWWIPKIKADSAWDIAYPTSGGVGSSVVLAIADGGVDLLHEDIGKGSDLYSNLWTNTGEIPGDGIDNDNNLVIDDVHGCWYAAPTLAQRGNPQAVGAWPFMMNANQHGTCVAGLAGAKTNNLPAGSPSSVATGMAGVAGGNNSVGVQMMGIRITDDFHQGNTNALKEGIDYAVDNGARIINLSWQFGFNQGLNTAIQNAVNGNVLFVAASGNDGVQPVVYPASVPQVLAVGGTNALDYRWQFNPGVGASYGAELDVAAPAQDISSTLNGGFYMHPQPPPPNGFQVAAGTSNAAPMVSGIAAMMLHVNPCLTANNLQEMLKHTAVKAHPDIYNYYWYIGKPGHSKELGYGRVDAFEAVKAAKSWAMAPPGDAYIKDFPSDWGAEPSTTDPQAILWESPDIWVRNQNDYVAVHESPEYGASTPV